MLLTCVLEETKLILLEKNFLFSGVLRMDVVIAEENCGVVVAVFWGST